MRLFRRTSRLTAVVLLAPLCLLAACSPYVHDLRRVVEPVDAALMERRLHDVGLPLLVAAAEWCPFEQESTYGFLLKDEGGSYDQAGHSTSRKAIVAYVHPQLAAASAGLSPGDRVVQVNTQRVGEAGAEDVMLQVRRLTAARIQPLLLEVERGAERRMVAMWAVPSCQFSLRLIESEQINGVSNGRQVAVTTGAMRFFVWDDELAWMLSHEIAHNVLSHVDSAKLRLALGAFLGATVGPSSGPAVSPPSRSLEAQADYVGSYLMARAGYDLDAVRRVWLRLANIESRQAGLGYEVLRSHPTTVERLADFEQTLKEIKEKRRRGESLEPRVEQVP